MHTGGRRGIRATGDTCVSTDRRIAKWSPIRTHESPLGIVVFISLRRWFVLSILVDGVHVVIRVIKTTDARILCRWIIVTREMGLKIRASNIGRLC
jgi:hypothetical protein